MSVTAARSSTNSTSPAPPRTDRGRGFRPSSRSRTRIAIGVLLATVSVAAMLLVFSTLDKREPVLQLVRDVPAGDQLVGSDFRVLEVSADPSLETVRSSELASIVGQYAKVRMISGSLLARPMLQAGPLVAPGMAVVALTVPSGELPVGLRERSQVQVVFPADTGDLVVVAPVTGRVVGLPSVPDSVSGQLSLSIELSAADAATVAGAADKARIVLLDPGTDAAAGG